jgi:hypothetical protein
MSAKTSLEERLMRSESEIVQKTLEANKMSNDLALIKEIRSGQGYEGLRNITT